MELKDGTANSNVRGGNGTYQVGNVTLNKNTTLNIYVGGQNGYNGGGAGNSIYGVGGGATDIRVGGTANANRIFVAGGGGGSSATPNYHQHTGSSVYGGGCYGQPNYHSHSGSSTTGGGCYGIVVNHTHNDSCYEVCGATIIVSNVEKNENDKHSADTHYDWKTTCPNGNDRKSYKQWSWI